MSGRLDIRELSATRWYLGQLLVVIALLGSYTIDVGSSLLVTAGLSVVVLACAWPRLVERIPKLFWRLSPFLLLAVIVADFLFSGGDILPPLFRMVVLLTLYRALQLRSPREDLQLLLLTLFLILITGVLSLEISFALQMLAYAPLAMGLLFVTNLTTAETSVNAVDLPKSVFDKVTPRRMLRRLRERLDRRTLVAGTGLFFATTGMALLLFVLLPRFDIGAALPFPRLQGADSLTGFTDHVQYGDVVSILNDDSIAMRVDVDMDNPPAQPYWRMVALDAYYDGGFLVSPRVAGEHRTVSNYRFDFDQAFSGRAGGDSVWTIYLEGGVSAYLPTGDTFGALRFNNRIDLQIHDLTRVIKTRETNATTLSLRYRNLGFGGVIPVAIQDMELLNRKPLLVDTSDRRYLTRTGYPETLLVVPEGEANRRILDEVLARIGPLEGLSVEEFSQRLVNYLRAGRGYSLESRVPPGEADTVLRWVDSGMDGHCELYAGAFVLISRYAGIPARLITGFSGGDWNGFENYFMVRNRNAHAWCEVFDRSRGWVRVDPTPGYGRDPGSVDDALAGGGLFLDRTWTAYLDSLRVLWFRRVIQFDSEDQAVMAESVKGAGLRGIDWIKELWEKGKNTLKNDWKQLVQDGRWGSLLLDVLVPVTVILLASVVIILIRKARFKRSFEAVMRKRAGRLIGELDPGPENVPALEHLRLIRFGPVRSWPADPLRVIKQIRRNPRRFGDATPT
jgi:transglutaminase-like putative cysteine protease